MQDTSAPFGDYSVNFTNDQIDIPNSSNLDVNTGDLNISYWAKLNTSGIITYPFRKFQGSNQIVDEIDDRANQRTRFFIVQSSVDGGAASFSGLTATDWNLYTYKRDTLLRQFHNGVQRSTHSDTGRDPDNTANLFLGLAAASNHKMREFRYKIGASDSADWTTTEYNNQNSNGSFWEATDAGGGAAAQVARRGAVMMM